MLGEDMVAGRDKIPTTQERACNQGFVMNALLLHRLKERQRRLLNHSGHTGQPESFRHVSCEVSNPQENKRALGPSATAARTPVRLESRSSRLGIQTSQGQPAESIHASNFSTHLCI